MLSVYDVAKELGVHFRTVTRWIREGKLKGVKIGSQWKITQEELERVKESGLAKDKYIPKSFESVCPKNDICVEIPHSMLLSKQWQSLYVDAGVLYVYCLLQDKCSNDNTFTFPKNKWLNEYKLYKRDNGEFETNMKQLINHGFIECLDLPSNTLDDVRYRLSNKWKSLDIKN